MAITILTNIYSLIAQQNLNIAQRSLSQALERLSSTLRINHASDDPSGAAIVTQMTMQINGEAAGTNNLNMAVDLLNTADSYTNTISEDLVSMNDLATQANNALLTPAQRQSLNAEFVNTITEIQRLATNASFNQRTLLDGSLTGLTVQSGFSVTDTISITIGNLSTGATGLNIAALGISTQADAVAALAAISTATVSVLSPVIARIGAQAASWMSSVDAQNAYITNLTAARSRIRDADIAAETTNLTNAQIILQSGIAALAQANSIQAYSLGLLSNLGK